MANETWAPRAVIALIVLLGALAGLSAAGAEAIALRNGTFEEASVPGPQPFPGWSVVPGSEGAVHPEATVTHGGEQAARIHDGRPDAGYTLESGFYPAVPGQTYRASGWVYNGRGDGWLYLEFYADPRRRLSERHRGAGTLKTWSRIEVEEVCPAEARYVAVALYSSIANVGESAWDDVSVEGPRGEGETLSAPKPLKEEPVDYRYLANVGDRKQLLFDAAFFERHKDFWWRVCPPRKTGERNLVADRPWESFVINAWHTVMEDQGKFRLWYEAYDASYSSDLQARYCYAESADGIRWTKPNLGLVEFAGSKENNILFGQLGGEGVHGGTVFLDPKAAPEEHYKFVYLGPVGKDRHAVRAALSPDGIHWQRHEGGAILNVSSDTQTVCFRDERLDRYVAYCRLWTPKRTIGRAESPDFLHFPDAVEVLGCDAKDPDDTDMYNSAALRYPYAENAYFIFTSMYHHTADNVDVQLAVSRDGVHWSRPDRTPFIPNGAPGEFDDASIYAGVGVLRQGDELWMYYSASRGRHNQNYPKWLSYHGVYTRAILTLDRYVGLQANLAPAEFVTLPLTFSGNRLELNADCGPAAEHWPAGAIRVELQEPDGTPIPGFALDECQPVVGDSVRHTVSWKAGADVGSRAGKPTRMRCVATDATLFAFQFARRQ